VLAGALAACGARGGVDPAVANTARGPITIWYSNNEDEVAWAQETVAAWNAEHPDEPVTAGELPAGETSEEVITASITAGNTPCLIYNTAPAAVPQFQRQGGLVPLDTFPGGREYVEERTGPPAERYQSEDGQYYQLPWKANPVMIFYNRALFEQAGLDPDDPPLATYDEFLATAQTLVDSGAADAAIWPSPTSQFFQSWFDFYPLYAAQSGGRSLVEDGEPTFTDPDGLAVAEFWRTLYERGLARREEFQGDAFGSGAAAMASAGPWAIITYDDVDWGVAPLPTRDGTPPEQTWTFSDAKSVAMYASCENRLTAWEFLQFSTSEERDGRLLELAGQMPMREDLAGIYPEYFAANPDYASFADQAQRMNEVPVVRDSIEVWQTFRNAYSASVIFGDGDIEPAFDAAATEIGVLVNRGEAR
jgi:multiple sugar transport system substrate-binding protein